MAWRWPFTVEICSHNVISLYWYIVVYWRNIIHYTDSPLVQVTEVNFAKAEMRGDVHGPEIQATDSYAAEMYASIESENILRNILVKICFLFTLQNASLCNADCSTMIATKFWVISLELCMKVMLEILKKKKIFRTNNINSQLDVTIIILLII